MVVEGEVAVVWVVVEGEVAAGWWDEWWWRGEWLWLWTGGWVVGWGIELVGGEGEERERWLVGW